METDSPTRHLLSSGWYNPELVPGDEDEEVFRWTRDRNALVEIPVVSPSQLTLRLDVAPHVESRNLPEPTLRVLWNNHDLGTFTLEWKRQQIELEIPAEIQFHGMNRLKLQPGYWLRIERTTFLGPQKRDLGIRCWGISVTPKTPQVASTLTPAVAEEEMIVQTPGTTITYSFALPNNAALVGRAVLRTQQGDISQRARGRVSVTLLTEANEERLLLTRDLAQLAKEPQFAIEEDLSAFGGQMASLTLSFSLLNSGVGEDQEPPSLTLEWEDVRIEGTEEFVSDDGVDALRGRYNVLFVLFDTLRADHTEPYGSRRVKTPALARLAAEGVTFENAFANSSWTRPSVAALLTSLYTRTLKIDSLDFALPQDVPYLPEILKANGYRTMAIMNNPTVSSSYGFDRGFDEFHDYHKSRENIREAYVTPEEQADHVWDSFFEPFLNGRSDSAPFFIYLHEIDPHAPYEPAPPYDEMYGEHYDGNLSVEPRNILEDMVLRGVLHLGASDLRHLESQYDGEVSFMDAYLDRVLDKLEERGLRDDTIVVFLSDHGEEFMEHEGLGHGVTIFEEQLRVPLVFSLPGFLPEGLRVKTRAQLLDVTATILDLIEADEHPPIQGRSLLPYIVAPPGSMEENPAFARIIYDVISTSLDSIHFRNWKVIATGPLDPKVSYASYQLYDLDKDPGELIDRWSSRMVEGSVLRQMLAWQRLKDTLFEIGTSEEIDFDELDPETLKNLRALGYLK
ncbi:sulfatase [Candidatus Sumerlaeota bacterium]|nr:sulfatase [Candidatus Sumerlaeota bacterium]